MSEIPPPPPPPVCFRRPYLRQLYALARARGFERLAELLAIICGMSDF